jgi:predicted RNA methylase
MKQTISQLKAASKMLVSFAAEMAAGSKLPVLDAGCGFGRNAVALAIRGMSVVCADKRIECLKTLRRFGSKDIADHRQPKCGAASFTQRVSPGVTGDEGEPRHPRWRS